MHTAYPSKILIPNWYLSKVSRDPSSGFFGIERNKKERKRLEKDLFESYINYRSNSSISLYSPLEIFNYLKETPAGELTEFYMHDPVVLTQVFWASRANKSGMTKTNMALVDDFGRNFVLEINYGADKYAVQRILLNNIKELEEKYKSGDVLRSSFVSEIVDLKEAEYDLAKIKSPYDDIFAEINDILKIEAKARKTIGKQTKEGLKAKANEGYQALLEKLKKCDPDMLIRICLSKKKLAEMEKARDSHMGPAFDTMHLREIHCAVKIYKMALDLKKEKESQIVPKKKNPIVSIVDKVLRRND